MKTNLLMFVGALLLTGACKEKSAPEPEPEPEPAATTICLPTSITCSSDEGLNEVFAYNKYADLLHRAYFTRTDTVHHFDAYILHEDRIGSIRHREHDLRFPDHSYSAFNYSVAHGLYTDMIPTRKNVYPSEPKNTLLLLGYENYTYTPQFELKEKQVYKDYRLATTWRFTYANKQMRHVEVYDGASEDKVRDIELTFDDQLFPHAENIPYKAVLVGLGWPHAHNILEAMVRDASGEVVEEESYRNTFTYNEQGYPLTITQNFLNDSIVTYTYTYLCKDTGK